MNGIYHVLPIVSQVEVSYHNLIEVNVQQREGIADTTKHCEISIPALLVIVVQC